MTATQAGLFEELSAGFDWDLWDGNPATTPAWIRAHGRRGAVPLALRDQGQIVGILERKALGWYGPVGRYHGGFAALPGRSSHQLAQALSRVVPWGWIGLPHATPGLGDALRKAGLRRLVGRTHDKILCADGTDVSLYLEQRPRKLRATLRKAERGAIDNDLVVGTMSPGRLSAHWNEIERVERVGHRRKGHLVARRSIREVLADLDRTHRLQVHTLHDSSGVHGYLIAGRGLTQDYFYTMGIRSELAAFSAGSLLFAHAISRSIETGKTANLGPGDTPFKRRFATSEYPQVDILLLPSWASCVSGVVATGLRRLTGSEWG